MKITALAPWFGSKRNLAPEIVRELGDHAAYWEPFCGSMAVLLSKPQSSHEHVSDLHGDLINLARCIKHEHWGPWLYRHLRRTLFVESLHDEAKDFLTQAEANSEAGPWEGVQPNRALLYFVMSWMGRNGVSGTCSFNQTLARRWTPHGGHGGQRFSSAVNSIPQWRKRLRRVCIMQEDGFDLIDKIDDTDGVCVYCDPPYLVKGARYTHDFTDVDHQRLADALARFQSARVIVSYYDHRRLAELYPLDRWTHRKIDVSKATAHQGRRGGNDTRATEVLIINGPSYATEHEQLFAGAAEVGGA